jgi:hypothetical protein
MGLLGVAAYAEPEIDRWLHILVEAETIVPREESRFPGDAEYSFRHALLRDAAYSLLDEQDRRTGHRLVGDYLGRMGETDPLTLAEHYRLGGALERAAALYARAVEHSLASDSAATLAQVERGIACGATGEVLGTLHAAAALAHMWHWNLAAAAAAGAAGVALLRPGSVAWCRALTARMLAAGLRAEDAVFAELLELTMETPPLPGAEWAFFEQASTGVFTLCMAGRRSKAEALLERLGAVYARLDDGEVRARAMFELNWFTYEFYLQGNAWSSSCIGMAMTEHYQLAGDLRYVAVAEGLLGATLAELGAPEEGVAHIRSALALFERMDEELVSGSVKAPFTLVLAALDTPEHQAEALTLAAEVVAQSPGPNLWAGIAKMAQAWVRLAQGDPVLAEHEARQALATLVTSWPARPLAFGLLCRALLGQGRVAEACQAAGQGLELLDVLGTSWMDVRLLIAAAEAHQAAGDQPPARALMARAVERMTRSAAGIGDAVRRERFLGQAEYVRAREQAAAWGDGP